MRKELDKRLAAAGLDPEWGDVVRDLDRVEEVTVDQDAKRFVLRTDAVGCAAGVFKAVGVALPPLVRQLPATTPPPKPAAPHRNAAGGRGVVPRAGEFPESQRRFNRLAKTGV